MPLHAVVSTFADALEPPRLCKREALPRECPDYNDPVLRPCQNEGLKACAKGARVIEMACGTGKTRVMKELVKNISGRVACPALLSSSRMLGVNFALGNQCRVELAKVLIIVPLRALLDQFAPDFPGFCKVGTGYNQKIDLGAKGFIAVAPSLHHLARLKFDAVFVDEAHHPLPARMPKCKELYRFSATHTEKPDYRYPMGQAIDEGVLCDYDITVPAVTEHHAYVCLADLLLKQAGRFRRVLAYCNKVAEAKKFQMVLEELGLAAWHINATTSRKRRMAAIEEFSGDLTKPVHVMVTVEVLGEGINIPNADTCMFVEPRNSYRSVIQAIGRALRHHPCKTLAHIVLPAVAVPARVESEMEEGWSTAQHDDMGGAETREVSGTVPLNAYEENAPPDQALPHLVSSVAKESNQNKGQDTRTLQEYPPRPTPASTTAAVDLVETPTLKDPRGMPQVTTMAKRDYGLRKVEEVPAQRKGLDDTNTAANVMGEASQECVRRKSLSRAQSSSSSTSSSSSSSTSLPSLEPMSPSPTLPSDSSMARGRQEESGKLWQLGPFAEPRGQGPGVGQRQQLQPWGVSDHDQFDQPRNSAYQGWSSPSMPATMTVAVQEDTAVWEQLHECYIGCANSRMEQRAVSSSVAEAEQTRGPGPQIRRMQLKSNLAPSDPNDVCGNQLERFLSLLVQADSRLVGSSVGHRIQLVDCRMTVEGQEFDSLTEVVYRRLTAILCQRDPWEDNLQSLEAFVEEKGRLPLRSASDERRLAYWLNTQQSRLAAGLLLEHRWRRLVTSSSPLIRGRAQGWPLNSRDGNFKRRCLELKAYIEMNEKLPRHSSKTSSSQSHRLARWLSGLAEGLWTKPERRAKLESLHPLVAEFLAKWDAPTFRLDVPKWKGTLQRLVASVQANGELPSSRSCDGPLYSWLYRNLLRLERLPPELVKQLHDSHPLIGAKVRAAQAKHRERASLMRGKCFCSKDVVGTYALPVVAKLSRDDETWLTWGGKGVSRLDRSFCLAQAALPAARNWAHAAQTPPWPRLALAVRLGVSRSRPASGAMGCAQEMPLILLGYVGEMACRGRWAGRSALRLQLQTCLQPDP